MKKIVLALAAMVVMASCTKDEVTTVNGTNEPIKFGTMIGGNSKGQAAVTTFGVIDLAALKASPDGFAVSTSGLAGEMSSTQVTHNGTSWAYTGNFYWPANASQNVSFTAYAPAGLAEAALAPGGLTITNYAPAATVANQVDILYAAPANFNRNTSSAAGVGLTFNHLLTQVVFAVNTDIQPSDLPKIVSIVLNVPKGVGSYNGAAWTTTATPKTYTVFNNNNLSSTAVFSAPLLMIPQALQAGTTVTVSFSVNGVVTTDTRDLSTLTSVTSWDAGTRVLYDISFNVTDLKVKFADPTISSWSNASDGWIY